MSVEFNNRSTVAFRDKLQGSWSRTSHILLLFHLTKFEYTTILLQQIDSKWHKSVSSLYLFPRNVKFSIMYKHSEIHYQVLFLQHYAVAFIPLRSHNVSRYIQFSLWTCCCLKATRWQANIWDRSSAPETRTTTSRLARAPRKSKVPGGTATVIKPTWTVPTWKASTTRMLTVSTGYAGKVTSTLSNSRRWRSDHSTSTSHEMINFNLPAYHIEPRTGLTSSLIMNIY